VNYYWKITRVYEEFLSDEVGISGPRGCDDNLKSNPATFTMYDDDGNCYYQGMIYGDYGGLEPLYDFGMPNAGCTYIKINGEKRYG
jgi:hypothetical protein